MTDRHGYNEDEGSNPGVEAAISQLRTMYEFRNDEEVTTFLRENPHLCDLLGEAHDEIKKRFP